MEKKELARKDLEAIAAGQVLPYITASMILVILAVDLEATNMTAAQVQAQTGCEVQVR